MRWDKRFLGLARHIAEWSKDPSTQCGAVIVRPDRTIASVGFNGYPRGVQDIRLSDREYKLERIIHAEMNAILFLREPARGYSLYTWPLGPCCRCAAHIAQVGISEVIYPPCDIERWKESTAAGLKLLKEAGVETHVCEAFAVDDFGSCTCHRGDTGTGQG